MHYNFNAKEVYFDPARQISVKYEYLSKLNRNWKCQALSCCYLMCTPADEEKYYSVMYSIDGVHLTFNIRYASNL
jgi:hypothetical protein